MLFSKVSDSAFCYICSIQLGPGYEYISYLENVSSTLCTDGWITCGMLVSRRIYGFTKRAAIGQSNMVTAASVSIS